MLLPVVCFKYAGPSSQEPPAVKVPITTLFTANMHFGQVGALARYGRPFASMAEMEQAMLQHWNATVCPSDEIRHLGDLTIRQKPERVTNLLDVLNGNKHLITGNSDTQATTVCGAWTASL